MVYRKRSYRKKRRFGRKKSFKRRSYRKRGRRTGARRGGKGPCIWRHTSTAFSGPAVGLTAVAHVEPKLNAFPDYATWSTCYNWYRIEKLVVKVSNPSYDRVEGDTAISAAGQPNWAVYAPVIFGYAETDIFYNYVTAQAAAAYNANAKLVCGWSAKGLTMSCTPHACDFVYGSVSTQYTPRGKSWFPTDYPGINFYGIYYGVDASNCNISWANVSYNVQIWCKIRFKGVKGGRYQKGYNMQF